jgi:hypothetical protein
LVRPNWSSPWEPAPLETFTIRGCSLRRARLSRRRLTALAQAARPDAGPQLGAQLAVLVDGMYTSAAHLGPAGPAAAGPALADALLRHLR